MTAKMNAEDLERIRHGGWDPALRIEDQDLEGVFGEVVFGPLFFDNSPDPRIDLAISRGVQRFVDRSFFASARGLRRGYRGRGHSTRAVPRSGARGRHSGSAPRTCPLSNLVARTTAPTTTLCGPPSRTRAWWRTSTSGPATFPKPNVAPEVQPSTTSSSRRATVLTSCHTCSPAGCSTLPGLKFTVVESGAAWLAWVLESLDQIYDKHHMYRRDMDRLDLLPSEYFRRQGHACFMDAVHNRKFTGSHTIMFGTDYPHHEGTFHHTQDVISRIFEGVPEDETRMQWSAETRPRSTAWLGLSLTMPRSHTRRTHVPLRPHCGVGATPYYRRGQSLPQTDDGDGLQGGPCRARRCRSHRQRPRRLRDLLGSCDPARGGAPRSECPKCASPRRSPRAEAVRRAIGLASAAIAAAWRGVCLAHDVSAGTAGRRFVGAARRRRSRREAIRRRRHLA